MSYSKKNKYILYYFELEGHISQKNWEPCYNIDPFKVFIKLFKMGLKPTGRYVTMNSKKEFNDQKNVFDMV